MRGVDARGPQDGSQARWPLGVCSSAHSPAEQGGPAAAEGLAAGALPETGLSLQLPAWEGPGSNLAQLPGLLESGIRRVALLRLLVRSCV